MGRFPPSAVSARAVPQASAARSPALADRLREIETARFPARGYGIAPLIFEGQPLQAGEASAMGCARELGIPGQREIAIGRAANISLPPKARAQRWQGNDHAHVPRVARDTGPPRKRRGRRVDHCETEKALIGACKVGCRIVGTRNCCRPSSHIALAPLPMRENELLSKILRRTERSAERSLE